MSKYNKAYREAVVDYILNGHTHQEAADTFHVCLRTIGTWVKMAAEGKELEFHPKPRPPHRLHNEELVAYMKEHPDAILKEVAGHFGVAISAAWNGLKRNNIKRKKNRNGTRRPIRNNARSLRNT